MADAPPIDPCDVTVRSFLENLAVALRDVNERVARIDEAIERNRTTVGALLTDQAVVQDVDIISQILSELSDLLVRIETEAGLDAKFSIGHAARNIRLEALQNTILTGESANRELGRTTQIQFF